MLNWLTRWRALSFGASCLAHAALIAGILAVDRWILSLEDFRLPVLVAEVVTMSDARPPVRPAPGKSAQKVTAGPIPRLLKPAEAPLPQASPAVIQPAPVAQPAVPDPQLQAPVAAPTGLSLAAKAEPLASSDPVPAASVSTGGESVPPTSAVASAPIRDADSTGTILRHARPQGGYQVRPIYPSSALRQGIQGIALLKVHVLVDGRVGEIIVQQSAGHPDLDRAATDAVRRWRFDPARRGHDPVAMWVLLPVDFQIK